MEQSDKDKEGSDEGESLADLFEEMPSYIEQDEVAQDSLVELTDYDTKDDIVATNLEQHDDFDLIIDAFYLTLVDVPHLPEKGNGLCVLEERSMF